MLSAIFWGFNFYFLFKLKSVLILLNFYYIYNHDIDRCAVIVINTNLQYQWWKPVTISVPNQHPPYPELMNSVLRRQKLGAQKLATQFCVTNKGDLFKFKLQFFVDDWLSVRDILDRWWISWRLAFRLFFSDQNIFVCQVVHSKQAVEMWRDCWWCKFSVKSDKIDFLNKKTSCKTAGRRNLCSMEKYPI